MNFPWKRPILSMNNTQIKEQILHGALSLENIHFWAILALTACGTFLFLRFICIWFQILHVRIQSLKKSHVVAVEFFSIELKETIVHKCSKKSIFKIMEELMLYFISFRGWVENLHIQNCIKNLMVMMPSSFYKTIKDKTWKSSVKKAILVTLQTYKLYSTLYWGFHWVRVRISVGWGLSGLKKNKFENLKSKFKNWYKTEIQT